MKDWSLYTKGQVQKDKALFQQFADDYKRHFGELHTGCGNCIQDALQKLTQKILNSRRMKKECRFTLKKKYEGVFWKGKPIRNYDLTDKIGEDLLKKHPAGEQLFDYIGKKKEVVPELTFAELKKKYPDVKANTKKDFLKKMKEISLEEE